MTRPPSNRDFQAACLAVLLAFVHLSSAQSQETPESGTALIAESQIAALQEEFAQYKKATSSTSMRRTFKSTVRKAEAVLKASPDAPNRFRVLAIVLQSQKRLLRLDNSDRNRNAIFDTCGKLAKAPDEYASIRLEADLLLSDKALTLKEADLKERAEALAEIVRRYRDTPAEMKSLMMALMIAPKLEAFDLEKEFIDAMDERFADDPTVIEWRRKHLGISRLDVLFAGTYTRADGVSLKFPIDRLGHHCLMVFWSSKTPTFEETLKQFKKLQDNYPDLFRVYSFNLDELPDAGQSILRRLKLDWTAMRLPGGKKSQAYRTYARTYPTCILINGYGRAMLMPTNLAYGAGVRSGQPAISDARLSEGRHLVQLQSLFIGDFLVTGLDNKLDPALPPELQKSSFDGDMSSVSKLTHTADSVPKETLNAIQACFTIPPLRYRLTSVEALANYKKAHKLCLDAIKKYPKDPNLWIVRNRGIISLLGMWNLTGEPKYLAQAAKQSRTSLATELPPAAAVVGRFCLAKQSIRQGDAKPKTLLSELVEDSGGEEAPASAFAAAAILAIDAHAKDLHEQYRGKFLDAQYDGNPSLWSFVSFLRGRFHRYTLLRANYTSHERKDTSPRGYIINHGFTPTDIQMPKIELKTLDGKTFSIPKDTNGKLTLLTFVEPPEVIKTELDAKGKPKRKNPNAVMERAHNLAGRHIHKELNVVAAFLCDDPNKIKTMMKVEEWTCKATMVPGGLTNPMVRQLGILSADRIPNVFLLRRDGTIAWQSSGLKYKAEYSHVFSVYLAMKVHTEICDSLAGYRALQKGDFKKAKWFFSGPFLPEGDERYRWAAPRFHGRALANMGLKDWKAALADIDTAIDAHQQGFNHAKLDPCEGMVEMQLTRAIILEKLGQTKEAKAARQQAAIATSPPSTSPYQVFHGKLKQLRLNQH